MICGNILSEKFVKLQVDEGKAVHKIVKLNIVEPAEASVYSHALSVEEWPMLPGHKSDTLQKM